MTWDSLGNLTKDEPKTSKWNGLGLMGINEAVGAIILTLPGCAVARPPFVRVHVEILMHGCERADRGGSCVLGAHRGGWGESEGALKISFLHLHLTHFTTPLFRQYNHFNNCLPSSAPTTPPSHLSFYWQEKMMYLQTHLQHFQHYFCFQHSYEKVLLVQVLRLLCEF